MTKSSAAIPNEFSMKADELMGMMESLRSSNDNYFGIHEIDVMKALNEIYKLGFYRGVECARQRGECHE